MLQFLISFFLSCYSLIFSHPDSDQLLPALTEFHTVHKSMQHYCLQRFLLQSTASNRHVSLFSRGGRCNLQKGYLQEGYLQESVSSGIRCYKRDINQCNVSP